MSTWLTGGGEKSRSAMQSTKVSSAGGKRSSPKPGDDPTNVNDRTRSG